MSRRPAYEIASSSAWSAVAVRSRRNSGYSKLSLVIGFAVAIDDAVRENEQPFRRRRPATDAAAPRRSSGRRTYTRQQPAQGTGSRLREVTRFRTSCRQPKITSARTESSQPESFVSLHSSRSRRAEPNFRRTSSGSRPFASASSICDCNFFVDLPAQAIAAKHVGDTRPVGHVMPSAIHDSQPTSLRPSATPQWPTDSGLAPSARKCGRGGRCLS